MIDRAEQARQDQLGDYAQRLADQQKQSEQLRKQDRERTDERQDSLKADAEDDMAKRKKLATEERRDDFQQERRAARDNTPDKGVNMDTMA